MKRAVPTFLGVLIVFIPQISYEAETACSVNGYSVVYINGILTNQEKAESDKDLLFDVFEEAKPGRLVRDDFKLGYNASHLGGVGDIVKAIVQKMWELEGKTKEDFDLLEIVRRVQPQVHTQKILIVGHSQGTFYANALYDYLMRRGVSADSVAVLNLAAPVSYTAGHGKHLTSTSDELVRQVRALAQKTEHPEPLPANLNIPKNPLEQGTFAGHSLADVYLEKKSAHIATAIAQALSSLKADPTRDRTQPCIPEPEMKITHYVKGASFALLDTIGSAIKVPLQEVAKPVQHLASAITGFGSVSYAQEKSGGENRGVALSPFDGDAKEVMPEVPVEEEAPVEVESTHAPFEAEYVIMSDPEPPVQEIIVPKAPEEKTEGQVLGAFTVAPTPPPVGSGLFGITGIPQSGGVAFSSSGGGGSAASVPEPAAPAPAPTPDPTLTLAIESPTADALLATTTLTVSGTVDAESEVMVSVGAASSTTTTDDAWSFTFTVEEGVHEILVSATSTEGLLASGSRAVTIDVTAPEAPAFSIDECAVSLSPDVCLLTNGNVTVSIDEPLDDALYWEVMLATETQGTSTERTRSISFDRNDTYTISVTAFDEAGNESVAATTSVVFYEHPLVINEVAWAGTTASRDDAWVELMNISPYTLALDAVELAASSGAFSYTLSGTLVPYETTSLDDTYLIESRSAATTMAHNQLEITLVLADEGDQLTLSHSGNIIDLTPVVETCGGWCAGALKDTIRYSETLGTQSGARSMERIFRTEDAGELASSWQTHDTYIYSRSAPKDASGDYILGSPKRDSSEGLPLSGWYCGASPFEAGASYVPESSVCTYLSAFMHMNVNRYGALFRGIVGSSTEIVRNSLGKNIFSSQGSHDIIDPVVGEPYFAVVYELRSGPSLDDVTGFSNYFTGVSTTPPHSNYRVFEWVYGE